MSGVDLAGILIDMNYEYPELRPALIDFGRAIADLERVSSKWESIRTYLAHQQRRGSVSSFSEFMKNVGNCVVPIDQSTGHSIIASSDEVAQDFVLGGALGIALVRPTIIHKGMDVERLVRQGIEVASQGSMSDGEYAHYIGSLIMSLGGQGLSLLGDELPDRVDVWLDQIQPDYKRQKYSRHGLGLTLYLAHDTLAQDDMESMRRLVAGADEIDWDILLTQ